MVKEYARFLQSFSFFSWKTLALGKDRKPSDREARQHGNGDREPVRGSFEQEKQFGKVAGEFRTLSKGCLLGLAGSGRLRS